MYYFPCDYCDIANDCTADIGECPDVNDYWTEYNEEENEDE